MSSLKIVFATDGLFPEVNGGIQRHTTCLAAALVEAGATVEVIAPDGGTRREFPFPVRRLSWPSRGSYPLRLWRWAGLCSRAIDGRGYDVVYGQGLTLLGRLRESSPPSVFNPHGLEFCTIPGPVARLKAWPLRIGARRQLRQASRTISLGGRLTTTIESCLAAPLESISEIPNAVDHRRFVPGRSKSGERIVLFVGRIAANKGVDVLCRATALLPPDVRVVIVGDGPLRAELERRFDDRRIEFRGGVDEDELVQLYHEATVLALPTHSDGMPTVILEAFSCGTPVVATDVGAIAELVDQTTGILIERAEPAPLAEALVRILELEPSERDELGRAARRRVEERFTWPSVAARTLALLSEVATAEVATAQ